MEGAYRSLPQGVAPRADDVRWRVRVARSVSILIALIITDWLLRFLVLMFSFDAPSTDAIWALAVFLSIACCLAQTWCAWVMTARRPSAKTSIAVRMWVVRGLAIADTVLMILAVVLDTLGAAPRITEQVERIAGFGAIALVLTGLWFISALFRELDLEQRAYFTRNTASVLLFGWSVILFLSEGGGVPFLLGLLVVLGCSLRALFLVKDLRRALRVAGHEWWVDANDIMNPQWASLVVSGEGLAEVLMVDGTRFDFANKLDAEAGLGERGFMRGQEALARGQVKRVPPSPLDRS